MDYGRSDCCPTTFNQSRYKGASGAAKFMPMRSRPIQQAANAERRGAARRGRELN